MQEHRQKDFPSEPDIQSQRVGQGQTAMFALLSVLLVIALVVGCAGLSSPTLDTNPPPAPHSAVLTWAASATPVVGYDIYRSATDGGPYVLLNSTPITGLTYTDTTVQSGQTYFYVTTAVDNNGVQSPYSNQVQAVIP